MKIKNLLNIKNMLIFFKRYESKVFEPGEEQELTHVLDLTKEAVDYYKNWEKLGFKLELDGKEQFRPLAEAEEIHLFGETSSKEVGQKVEEQPSVKEPPKKEEVRQEPEVKEQVKVEPEQETKEEPKVEEQQADSEESPRRRRKK